MKCSAELIEARDSSVAQVKTILETVGLLDAYEYMVAQNPSNELPYHNLHHTHCLIINCADGAAEMQLPVEKRRALLLSAVFHDFGHSGGRQSDDQNIRTAIEGLKAYCANDASFDDCLDEVTRIIESTLFPPVADPVTLSERIIRDADMMQIYMPRWQDQILGGLRAEIEVATGKKLSLPEMVRLQVKFMESVKWHTSWATRRAERQWASLIEQVKRLESSAA